MPKTSRAVIEGVPYHVTQRGNRREDIFFEDENRQKYLEWLRFRFPGRPRKRREG